MIFSWFLLMARIVFDIVWKPWNMEPPSKLNLPLDNHCPHPNPYPHRFGRLLVNKSYPFCFAYGEGIYLITLNLSIPIKTNTEMPYPLTCNFACRNLLCLHTKFLSLVPFCRSPEARARCWWHSADLQRCSWMLVSSLISSVDFPRCRCATATQNYSSTVEARLCHFQSALLLIMSSYQLAALNRRRSVGDVSYRSANDACLSRTELCFFLVMQSYPLGKIYPLGNTHCFWVWTI